MTDYMWGLREWGWFWMTSKLPVYISREMERKLWRNNRFGGLTMNSDLDVISWKCLGHLKTSRKPLKPG